MSGFTITFRRAIALVLTPVIIAGCYSWVAVEDVAPQTVVETKHPSRIKVETNGGDRIELLDPRIAGDSLVGDANGYSVAVALADVTRVETREAFVLGTLMVVGLVAGTVYVIATGISLAQGDFF